MNGTCYRRGVLALAVAFFLTGIPTVVAQEPDRPFEKGLIETERVALAEFRILVTDRAGRAVTDLDPSEIHIFEKGVEQTLAFLETVAGRKILPILRTVSLQVVPTEPQPPILPASVPRRLVLTFDIRNSRKEVRHRWQAAAREWVATGMEATDQVGIVLFGTSPEWLLQFTNQKDQVLEALDRMRLENGTIGRDRGKDMSSLMSDMQTCAMGDGGKASGGKAKGCAQNLGQGYAMRWNVDAEETISFLLDLTGHLSSISGRKAVLLFSEGVIGDASMMAVDAYLATFGVAGIFPDLQKMKSRYLGRDVYDELSELQAAGRRAGVAFFTLDTWEGKGRGFDFNLENASAPAANTLGLNPWQEINDSTTATLDQLARETGGRSFHGVQNLAEKVRSAADSFFGMYTVGYYRTRPDAKIGKARIKVDRKKVDIVYQERAEYIGE